MFSARSLTNRVTLSFVDRDMFMRYRGGGVGHRVLWPLREIMRAVGHTRAKHQAKRKEDHGEDSDMMDEGDELQQEVEYDDDIEVDGPEGADGAQKMEEDEGEAGLTDEEDEVAIADEEHDYGYVMDNIREEEVDAEEDGGEDFDYFVD